MPPGHTKTADAVGVLVERERELSALDDLVAGAASGSARLAIIRARPGTGGRPVSGSVVARKTITGRTT